MTRWPSAAGPGANWSPGLLDRAETFIESGVSVSYSSTERLLESIRFALSRGTTASRDADAGSGSETISMGVQVSPNVGLDGLETTISSETGTLSRVWIERDSDGEVLARVTGSFTAGDTVKLPANLEAGTNYNLLGDDGGASYQWGYDNSDSFPHTSSDIDIVDGFSGGTTNAYARLFLDVTALIDDGATNASAIVEWDEADDLAGWDIVPYQAVPDGGTVEIYAVDPSDGTRLAGPLEDPGDISGLARSTNVAVEVVLSRSSTSENPRLEAVYRRRKIT